MTIRIFILCFLLCICSCKSPVEPPQENEEDIVLEALLRYQFAVDGSFLDNTNTFPYFIASVVRDSLYHVLKESDPPAAFMKRFLYNSPPVKGVSQCDIIQYYGVFDKHTKKQGILFRTSQVQIISSTSAQIVAGYYAGGINAIKEVVQQYQLKKTNGRWWVTNSTYLMTEN